MPERDYLSPFVEVGRTLAEGAAPYAVMKLAMQRIVGTLGLKGAIFKMPNAEGRLELISSHGLSEYFIFDRPENDLSDPCSRLPQAVACYPDKESLTAFGNHEPMLIEGIRSAAVIPMELNMEVVGLVALFAPAPREFSKTELNFAAALARDYWPFITNGRPNGSSSGNTATWMLSGTSAAASTPP